MNRESALCGKIEAACNAAQEAGMDSEQEAWLAEIMTIWTCAYLEHVFRARVAEFARGGSDPATANYVRNQMDRIRNPRVSKMCGVLGDFNDEWKKRFRERAGQPMLDSITSIVQQRNRIAHGERTDLTVRQVHDHFRAVRDLGDILAAVFVVSDRAQRQAARIRHPR